MHTLSGVLTDLLPKVIAKNGMESNKNREAVRADVDILANMAHNLDGRTELPSKDPSLKIVASEFRADITKIQELIRSERWAEAQSRLTQVTSYCMACHTMNAAVSSPATANLYADAPAMTAYERARYKTAIRQYEAALKDFEIALNDKVWAKEHPAEWDHGLMSLLTIVTHVKKNPNLALEMISAFRDKGSMPEYLRSSSLIWRQQAKAWEENRNAPAKLSTVEEWMALADKLKRPQYANVFMLTRASAWLHEKLATGELSESDQAKALYLQGLAGQKLGDLNYFVFPSASFKACINLAGETSALGQKCLRASEGLVAP